MSEHLRGYVLDNGFLVFGDGMIRLDDVLAVYDVSDIGINTLCMDGSILDFKRLGPDQERTYVSMLLDCVNDGSSFMPAEASTGCEPESPWQKVQRCAMEYFAAEAAHTKAVKEWEDCK